MPTGPPQRRAVLVASLVVCLTACGCGGGVLPEAGKGWHEDVCLPKANWTRLETLMRSFGAAHDMEFHGSIEAMPEPSAWPEKQSVNYALIRGLRQFGEDDFSIWLVSSPARASDIGLLVSTREDITAEEVATARQFRREVDSLTCEPGAANRKAGARLRN